MSGNFSATPTSLLAGMFRCMYSNTEGTSGSPYCAVRHVPVIRYAPRSYISGKLGNLPSAVPQEMRPPVPD